MSGRKLVIVESPAKARTISGYLGPEFRVEASVGHIRDLPQPSELPQELKKGPYKKFAIDIESDFEPYYVVSSDKKKKVAELRKAVKEADELYLATDEDREGEAIAWHLLEELNPNIPVKRMVFHEITREAIERALENTRDVDTRLVDAQETRRILDRLYGYEISPVLWRKVRRGLSAGRVQSVATRLVVDRERERMSFVSATYWDLLGRFEAQGQGFEAKLTAVDGTKVATGRDFNDAGELKTTKVTALAEQDVTSLAQGLQGATFRVEGVETKPYTRRPAAPFITSTLQQEASRKLRLSANQTMRTAQALYENGYITYMRTDSPMLSGQAIEAARRQATELYGAESVPGKPRFYGSRSKGAQEAHEAIRPAGDFFRTPDQVAGELSGDQLKLYDLIWKRTVASQMADAKGSTATIHLGATTPEGQHAEFSASGTVITFRGFLAAYEEGRDAERYDQPASAADARLPQVKEGDEVQAVSITPEDHSTNPPPRYTEASLVKTLEDLGIGRPSTYAATISVITNRGYVDRRGQALVPTWLAFSVTRLLEENYSSLVDYDFTAEMEADLDAIARGETQRVEWLTGFYFGTEDHAGLKKLVEDTGDIDARAINTISLGQGVSLRVGRYGPYVEIEGEEGTPQRASVPDDIAPDELDAQKALELIETQAQGDRVLGVDPETEREIVVKVGRFGPYVTEVIPEEETEGKKKKPKPKTASLFKNMSPETVDLATALKLLSLPRVVGTVVEGEGEEAKEVKITAQNGRYGPYLKKGSDSRSLENEDQIFEITLEEALEIYAQPKRGRGAAKPPLAEFGDDPVSGKPVVLKDGRYGPYVTDGTVNASLRQGDEVATLTKERAFELLALRRETAGKKKTTRAKKK